MTLPACALTTPRIPACTVQTLVATHVDAATKRVIADITVPTSASTAATGRSTMASPQAVQAASAPMLLGATTTSSGGGGDYKASSLNPSSGWTAGSSSGGLTYSYGIQVPPTLGGSVPGVSLAYDSSSVDGKTSATNAQSSWIGDGWDYNPGFIERTYQTCDKHGIDGSGDRCWAGENATMSFGSHSGSLVHDDASGVWRIKGDDGTKVEFLTGANNGANNGEYVKVTDSAGIIYYFGANYLPKADGTMQTIGTASQSVSTVPVYSPTSGDPCYDAGQGAASWCQMASRWALDYIVDPHGNLTTYTYNPETGYYARGGGQNNGTGTTTAYTRANLLHQIAYGQRQDEQLKAGGTLQPAARITFTADAERCTTDTGTDKNFSCAAALRSTDNSSYWPDVPVDQECPDPATTTTPCAHYGPTFFSTKKLTSITTAVRSNNAWNDVDSYALSQSFPPPGDSTSQRTLWLDSIVRTGKTATPNIQLPPVSFEYQMLPNRVDGVATSANGATFPDINRPRIHVIHNETGAVLTADYNLPGCSRLKNVMPTAEDNNNMSCFPVKWTPPGAIAGSDPILDWFNHYTVASLTTDDPTTINGGGYTPQQTAYTYTNPGWHRDDSEYTDANSRTWGDFRGYATVTTITGSGTDGPKGRSTTTYLQGMNGDKTTGTDRTSQFTDALGETVTDDDWLSGQAVQTDTYAQDESDSSKLKIVATTVNRTTNPVTTATHTMTGSTTIPVPVVARYAGTSMVTTTRSLKTDTTWRTTTKTTSTDPDHNNRPSTVLDQADGLPDLCTRTGYATGPDPQRTDLVDRTTVVSGNNACTATPAQANTVSDGEILYDTLPWGQAGTVANATGSQVLDSYDGSGKAHYTPKNSASFDSYGRLLTATALTSTDAQHLGGATTSSSYAPAAAGELPATVTVSAPVPGAPTTTWDTTTTFDVRRSTALTVKDPNSKVTTEAYDALGRPVSVWQAGRTTSQNPNRTFTYTLDSGRALPAAVTTASLKVDQTTSPTYTNSVQIMDGLGRVRQVQTNTAVKGITGRLISDSFRDSQGRVYKTNAPWYNADSGPNGTLVVPNSTPAAGDNQIPSQTLNTFDGRGRTTTSSFVSLGTTQWTTTTAYPGADRTDVTPPSGGWPTTTVTDSRGHTAELWQYNKLTPTGNPADATVTRYTYTPDGKPSTRTDAAGNAWSYGYDLLGRQNTATDPDTGTTAQTYDAAGNLNSVTDARNKTLVYTYDLIGRKTGEYTGSASSANQQAAWTYDSVTGGKGRPASSTRYTNGASGPAYSTTVNGYDDAYRPTGGTVSIPGSEVGQATPFIYTTSGTYDRVTGNLNTTALPGIGGLPAETVGNSYDAYGLLTKTVGKVTYDLNTAYDAFGRPQRTTVNPWATQVVATTVYDQSTGQATADYVDKQTSQNGQAQITNYTYNPAGQLTSITGIPDNTPAATDRQCFSYDSLGRLTTAWSDTGGITSPDPLQHKVRSLGACTNTTPTSGVQAPLKTTVGGGSPYWQDYTYDLTGNRRTLVQHNPGGDSTKDTTTTQTFSTTPNTPTKAANTGGGTGGPHALLSASTTVGTGTPTVSTSQFDEAGNTTSVTDTSGTVNLTWDGEDKLASVAKTGQSPGTTYIYDADGNQLIRHDPGKTTVNLGSDELTYDTTAKPPTLTGTRYYPMPNGMTDVRVGTAGLVVQLSDHHGTNSLAVNLTTLAETRRPTDPFGNPRGTQPAPSAWAGDKGFVGGTKDDTTGLTNLGAREYQPTTGRFLNPDPLLDAADPQQWNGYAYSNNNPVNASDPTGLKLNCGGDQADCPTDNKAGGVAPGGSDDNLPSDGTTHVDTNLVLPADFSNPDKFVEDYWAKRAHHVDKYDPELTPTAQYSLANDVCASTKGICTSSESIQIAILWGTAVDAVALLVGGGEHPDSEEHSGGRFGEKPIKDPYWKFIEQDDTPDAVKRYAIAPSLCGGNSFEGSTRVLLEDGSTKQIADVKIGDDVESADPETGKMVGGRLVTALHLNHDNDLVDLTVMTSDGRLSLIHTTANHPFWDDTLKSWAPAVGLTPGHDLATTGGGSATIHSVLVVPGAANMYNLTISDLHTYYVLAGATPVLVHNSGPCPEISTRYEKAGDLGKYTEGQKTRDPASQWYHEYLSDKELLDGVNKAAPGEGILVSRDGTILGGHHRWDEIQTRIDDGRIDPNTQIRIDVYGGE
ncbi:RHS repeat-associated core domain-containing protein [Kitasatospora sp. MAP5-34]|uniref:RHS repeat-associated core domain-containing protein n=1 Tax=Kitasatospora sp. MAP5-34 TaxID=3035102 RepID=UPI0024759A0A|nr:RHS repeat-associated core domain-containing protein [Kitasatospora sp. MAP5-34]